jgi:hypothetical protein
VGALEGGEQAQEGSDAASSRVLAGTDAPREIRVDLRRDPTDLAQRDPSLKGLLNLGPGNRRLAAMYPLEDERLRQVVSVGVREQPRPEVVVLALEERRVVSETVSIEQFAVDEHCWMEERRAEERMPTEWNRTVGHDMSLPSAPVLVEIGHGCAEDRDARSALDPVYLPLEALRESDVVGIESRDVAAGRPLEPSVQRCREAQPFVVTEQDETVVVDGSEDVRGLVGRRVVDDDKLEIPECLPEHARDGFADEAHVVANGEKDGDERHGRLA